VSWAALLVRLVRLVRWAARRVGYRGATLLFFGQLDLVIGWSLIDPVSVPLLRAAPAYRVLLAVGWLRPAWAGTWALVGMVCLVQAWQRTDRFAFAAAIGIKAVWSLGLLAAWPLGAPRGWVSAEVWLTMAGFVRIIAAWPEPARRGGPTSE
jgi:hypothetical protein